MSYGECLHQGSMPLLSLNLIFGVFLILLYVSRFAHPGVAKFSHVARSAQASSFMLCTTSSCELIMQDSNADMIVDIPRLDLI